MKYFINAAMLAVIILIAPACEEMCPCGYTEEPVFDIQNRAKYDLSIRTIDHETDFNMFIRKGSTRSVPIDMNRTQMKYELVMNGDTAVLQVNYELEALECDENLLLNYRFFSFNGTSIPLVANPQSNGMYCYNYWNMPEIDPSTLNNCDHGTSPSPPLFALNFR